MSVEGITEVADKTYRLEIPIAGAYVPTVAYFIKDGNGALIEPGPGAAVPALRLAIEHLGLSELAYIIPTHIHVDHAGSAGALAKLYPKAKVLVHPRGARHLANPAHLIEITERIYGSDFETRSGTVLPVPESQLGVVEHGEMIVLGDTQLQIIHAPGHSSHHFVILDMNHKGLFCGEALGLPPHLLPSVAPYSFDQDAYLDTIESLRQLHPRTLFYSHGGTETEPETAFSIAAETTLIYSKMVLEGIRNGDSRADIALRFASDVWHRFGLQFDPEGSEMFVTGYLMYYDRKGLA
jgi:glyoxylase-like metal-dependent hydrolase (beta-lactamase superfamily II)